MSDRQTPDDETGADSSGVAVLDRAFALMGAFGEDDASLSLTELSRRTGLYKSTVLRLLGALEHGGFVRKLPDGQYGVGPAPLRLATIYQRSFHVGHVIEPLLKQLSAATGETASFYVRHGDARIALFRSEPARSVRAAVAVGQQYTLRQGASGKVLCAFSEDQGADHADIRRRLWAVSYGEREPDTASVAAPVFTVNGQVQGAMAISGPRIRLSPPATMMTACRALLGAAIDASRQLGGHPAGLDAASRSLDIADFAVGGQE
ncbi:IclR family transcriptional regulator [Roseateles aquatilis]|uniref:IclR family transcriptional regulator n=1 Tax=Roseateles aquatilis TaxID=431061 RepID=A0A246JCT9_9BURK|nr:IclR family transcriptional regulator [Roseateles aquatilis]OWQ90380.1 IclR family transcriptional regulator [Roseateles aquatilis]